MLAAFHTQMQLAIEHSMTRGAAQAVRWRIAEKLLEPDFSHYPIWTVILVIITGSLTTSLAEEAGFRGYFQSALEARKLSPVVVVILSAIVIAPAHGLTQGFQWPTIVFYLLVDSMLGVMAYLTRSILPGIVVHCFGLLVFFSLIWPNDAHRNLTPVGDEDLRDPHRVVLSAPRSAGGASRGTPSHPRGDRRS